MGGSHDCAARRIVYLKLVPLPLVATITLYSLCCFLSIVLLPQRAQGRCLAVVVDALTGAARLRMMRWGETYTETCSSNQPLLLFSVFFIWFLNHAWYCFFVVVVVVFQANFHQLLQLQEEDTWHRSYQEKKKDLLWLLWEVCNYLCQLNYLFVDKTLTSECRLSLL